jgi:hypothetical protein
MPAFRSVVSVLSREPRETLLYTLKAGPTITGEPAPPHTQVDPTDVYALTDEDAYLEAGGDEKPAIVAEPMPDLFAPRVCLFCKKAAEHLFGEQYPKTDRPSPSSMGSGSATRVLLGSRVFSPRRTLTAWPRWARELRRSLTGQSGLRSWRIGAATVSATGDRASLVARRWSVLGPHGIGNHWSSAAGAVTVVE